MGKGSVFFSGKSLGFTHSHDFEKTWKKNLTLFGSFEPFFFSGKDYKHTLTHLRRLFFFFALGEKMVFLLTHSVLAKNCKKTIFSRKKITLPLSWKID